MNFVVCLALFIAACSVNAEQKCQGHPRMYNGKRCASTTRYVDRHKGACGCGPASGDSQFSWNSNGFVVAASQKYFDRHDSSWCGEHCGQCIKLTTTGGFVPGQGSHTPEGRSKVFMITNLCPNIWPNQDWCNQASQYGGSNKYGYEVHFDLENGVHQIDGMGWNNPEVTWEVVNCDYGHGLDNRTPGSGQWSQCQCAHQGKRSVNETMDNSTN